MNYVIPVISLLVAGGSMLISYLSFINHKARIDKFESNCIATLNANVNELKSKVDAMFIRIDELRSYSAEHSVILGRHDERLIILEKTIEMIKAFK